MKNIHLIVASLLLSLTLTAPVLARDFRGMIKIPVAPKNVTTRALTTPISPVDYAMVEKAVRKIVNSWNGPHLSRYLDKNFQDKTLLLTAIQRSVPMDAKLRLIAVHGISTLEQKTFNNPKINVRERKRVVIATVDLQLEFNDPFKGVVRLPHSSQFYLQIVEIE